MMGLRNMLIEEKIHLEKLIKICKAQLEDVPEGRLRVSMDKGRIRYFKCTNENKIGTYINKENRDIARKLAQKEYNQKILTKALRRLKQITNILKDYEDKEFENCLYSEHIARQILIEPVEQTWENKVEEWKRIEYTGNEFREDAVEIYTQNGERVRSKSEKILADYFYYHNIPYKYECPLKLKGYGVVYPDFTFLSKKTGKEIYWEHDGMMDDTIYVQNAIKKIEAYEKNDIFPGERLILTFETSQSVLRNDIIETMVEKYIL